VLSDVRAPDRDGDDLGAARFDGVARLFEVPVLAGADQQARPEAAVADRQRVCAVHGATVGDGGTRGGTGVREAQRRLRRGSHPADSTRTGKFTELDMKQLRCALSCSAASLCASTGSEKRTRGRSTTSTKRIFPSFMPRRPLARSE